MSDHKNQNKAIKKAYTRYGDQKYYLSKILSEKYLEKYPNPPFTKEDLKFKLELFEIPTFKTCFISGNPSNGVGDHFYEINGYYRYTGKYGIDDDWNIIPVCGALNKNYKIFKFTMNGKTIKKNIGYCELTIEELQFLLNSDSNEHVIMAEIYCKIHAWKMYVALKGAVICYEEPDDFKRIRNNHRQKYDQYWDETMNEINNL